MFAFSIAPNQVRSAGASVPLVIPDATDVVRLHLQGRANAGIEGARARIRTVAGAERERARYFLSVRPR